MNISLTHHQNWVHFLSSHEFFIGQPLNCTCMPRDTSIKSVLIIGSGPIIIGQACEFDYSGSQAARSLREEGIEVTLLNNNPATIMTDPVVADHVYLMPITIDSIVKILEERKD